MTNMVDDTSSIADIICSRAFLWGVVDFREGRERFDDVQGDLAYEYGRLYAACGGPVPCIYDDRASGIRRALPQAYVFCIQRREDITPSRDEPAGSNGPPPPTRILMRWYLEKFPEMRSYVERQDRIMAEHDRRKRGQMLRQDRYLDGQRVRYRPRFTADDLLKDPSKPLLNPFDF